MSGKRNIDDRDWGRRALGPARRKSIGALAEVIFSSEDEEGLQPAAPELVERTVDELDLLIGAGSGDLHRGFRLLAWLIEWLPLIVIGAFSRASRLPLARRLAYLEALDRSRLPLLPTLLVAFKLPLTMLAFELDPELAMTGYDRATLSTRRVLPMTRSEAPRRPSVPPPPASESRISRPPPLAREADTRPKAAGERT
jgi:hypothetical protein